MSTELMDAKSATFAPQCKPQPLPESPLIALQGVEKVYRMGKVEYRALRGVDLSIAAGEMVAVVGPSGSGKSTILNMITGIDRPTAGTVTVDGRRLDELSEEELAVWRGDPRSDRLRDPALHGPLPAGALQLRARARPLGSARRRLRRPHDRPVPPRSSSTWDRTSQSRPRRLVDHDG